LDSDLGRIKYGDYSYKQVAQLDRQVQQEHNKQGFNTPVFTSPIDMKRRFPNDNFLPKDRPNFFSTEYMHAKETAIGQELGTTGHTFGEGGNIQSGLGATSPASANTPMGQGSGAFTKADGGSQLGGAVKTGQQSMQVKDKVRASVLKITKLFDRLFSEEVFPDAVIDVQDDGKLFIRDGKGGRCILLARYYEYVQSSIQATLGLGRTGPLTWAKDIDLNFESIEKNKIPLRAALTEDCAQTSGYTLGSDGSVQTTDGKPIEIDIPWDKDQTILVNHLLKLGQV
jgi:hypothetical protein